MQTSVNTLELYLWLAQLDSEETSIEFREWAKRVDLARKEYQAAGWIGVYSGSGPQLSQASYWARIAAVDVGIGFGSIGIELHEIRDHDPEFRSAVSESGFRSLGTGDSCPDPQILMRDIERMIEKERKTKKPPRGITKGTLTCPNGCDIVAALESQRKPATAIAAAKRSDVPAVIEVVSTPAEKLSTEERKLLAQREKEIERSAHAFLDLGNALAEIQKKRLYRSTHSTFEAYLADRWHIERSVAYGLIAAVRVNDIASAIADKTGLRITNESQCRPLAKLDDADVVEVLKRAAKRITADADGVKVPTAKILAEVAREYITPPEDLRKAKAERSQKRPAVELIDQAEREEMAAESHGIAGDPSEFSRGFAITGPQSSEEITEERYRWNGRQCVYAADLHDVRSSLEKLFFSRQGNGQFRDDLAALLTSLAVEIKTGKVRSLPAAAVARTISLRRAK